MKSPTFEFYVHWGEIEGVWDGLQDLLLCSVDYVETTCAPYCGHEHVPALVFEFDDSIAKLAFQVNLLCFLYYDSVMFREKVDEVKTVIGSYRYGWWVVWVQKYHLVYVRDLWEPLGGHYWEGLEVNDVYITLILATEDSINCFIVSISVSVFQIGSNAWEALPARCLLDLISQKAPHIRLCLYVLIIFELEHVLLLVALHRDGVRHILP